MHLGKRMNASDIQMSRSKVKITVKGLGFWCGRRHTVLGNLASSYTICNFSLIELLALV